MSTTPTRVRHTWRDLYHERTHFQFVERSWRWALLSGTVLLISLVSFVATGLNLGIDFEGGTQWQFTVAHGSASVDDVRTVLDDLGLADAKVLIIGSNSVRVQAEDVPRAEQDRVSEALAQYGDVDTTAVSVTDIGPTWGDKVSKKALQALIVFFVVIAAYLSFRFEPKMAIAAIVAVVHDIGVTVGVYSVFGFEVTPATVVAFLTILGFSLYDTVVVFDKVRENAARLGTVQGDTYGAMVNRSLNQVLMRSINTSIVALLPVASLLVVGTYVFGGLTLKDFALALFVGLMTGAYSSIFVATPVLAWLKEREPRNQALRERSRADLARAARKATATASVGAVASTGALAVGEATDGPIEHDVEESAPVAPPPAAARPTPSPTSTQGSAAARGRRQRGRKRH